MEFFYLFAVIAIGMFVIFWFARRSIRTSRPGTNWQTTEGVAYVSRVSTKKDSLGDKIFEPNIKCVYKVKDVSYTMKLDDPVFHRCNQREWENVARYYPKEYVVTVHYDPLKPEHACVESSVNAHPRQR